MVDDTQSSNKVESGEHGITLCYEIDYCIFGTCHVLIWWRKTLSGDIHQSSMKFF